MVTSVVRALVTGLFTIIPWFCDPQKFWSTSRIAGCQVEDDWSVGEIGSEVQGLGFGVQVALHLLVLCFLWDYLKIMTLFCKVQLWISFFPEPVKLGHQFSNLKIRIITCVECRLWEIERWPLGCTRWVLLYPPPGNVRKYMGWRPLGTKSS